MLFSWDMLFQGFATALTPYNVFFAFIGCLIGTLVGVLPGIGPTSGIAILLPLTTVLPPIPAIIMMAAIYYGAMYGGSTTAIVVNIPGEAASVPTALDGYELAKQGRAGPALGIAAIGSFVAGTLSLFGVTFFAPMLAGVALAGLVYSVTRLPIWKSEGERAIERVWGPLLAPRAAVTLVLATPPQLWVRDAGSHPFPAGDPPLLLPAPGDPAFLEWHRRLTLRAEGRLFLHPNAHSPLWGDAAAAVEAARFLAARGVNVELMAEENIRPAALKERDAIVFGREDYSPSVAEFQPAGGHAVRFVPERRQVGVVDTRRGGGPALFRDQGGRVSYGLVTVLTWKASGRRPFRTLMFSGINSDGSHAGLNFMITPERMADLVKRILETGGRGRWPDSFQVVVRTRSVNTYTIQSEFAAFRRLE